jgi:hypothetical protein
MKHQNHRLAAVILSLAVFLGPGCGDDDPAKPEPQLPEGAVPDFSLIDVNPNSARHDEAVSPRDYLGSTSAYYFGSAT